MASSGDFYDMDITWNRSVADLLGVLHGSGDKLRLVFRGRVVAELACVPGAEADLEEAVACFAERQHESLDAMLEELASFGDSAPRDGKSGRDHDEILYGGS